MIQRKKQNEKKDAHRDERYQFMKEQVQPQKKKNLAAVLKKAGLIFLSACFFGVVAGSIILAMQKYADDKEQEEKKQETYRADEEPPSSPLPSGGADGKSVKKKMSVEGWNDLSERLAAVGTGQQGCVVQVQGVEDSKWFSEDDSTETGSAAGILFAESDRYFDIMTTSDVTEDQSEVEVLVSEDIKVTGEILGVDARVNIAVIRIRKSKIDKEVLSGMKIAVFGSSSSLVNGSSVVAIGCPNGVMYSVMTGQVTNDDLRASITDGELNLYSTSMSYSDCNSGVVLDTDGKVVGVIAQGFEQTAGTTALSFIDIDNISGIMEILQQKEEMPYMGFTGRTISETAASAHGLKQGAYVTEVYSSAPAYESGMRVADVITEMDGETVTGMADVYQILLRHKTDDIIAYTVYRKSGKKLVKKELSIVLG
ncbi:MAG: S1C family serine protease [Clostridiaceae bacterium]|nr:S1C family serine protease [Clostridiaceae bacterium]